MPEREPTIPPAETTETDVRTEYQQLLTLQEQLERAYEQATVSGDLSRAKELDAQLETRLSALEGLVNPLERELELKNQYERQRQILIDANVVAELSTGEYGIKDIDGVERPMPTLDQVRAEIRKHPEDLEYKRGQGFGKVLLEPIGIPLDDLKEKAAAVLRRHKGENTLFATKRNPTDPDEPLDLNDGEPVWAWDEYADADRNGKLVYFPKQFDADPAKHQGKTKQELITDPTQPFPGWRVLLVEDLPNIPRVGAGETKGARKQLETNKKGREYLALPTDPKPDNPYRLEEGFTPEAWLTLMITHVAETNQVIDDYQGNGSIAFLTGAYFPTSDDVPYAYWYRVDLQASLGRHDPGSRNEGIGARSAVRV